jgi:FkbM family methyltransferase
VIIKTKQKFSLGLAYLLFKPFSLFKGYSQLLYLITKFLPNVLFKTDVNIEIFNRDKKFNVNIKYPYMMDIFLKNKSELTVPALIIKLLKKNSSFVDVGANCGWFSKIISSFRDDVNIYCFEPSWGAYRELIKISNPQILVFPFAVSYADNKYLNCHRYLFRQESSAKFLDDNRKNNNHSVISIKLDSFFSKIKAYPTIIKIDVEGGELNVLKGAKKCLTQAEYVIVEVNEDIHCKKFGYKHDDIRKYLLKLKFKYFYHVSNKDKSVIKSDAFTPGDILFSKKRIVEFDV